MKKIGVVALLCSAALGPMSAHASKWGMAGCGVGSLIFEDKPGKIQILAATTNDYFVQSSSITSGTSGCVDMGAREEAMLYIQVNQEALAKDISRGNGESIQGLAKVLQCSDADQLGSSLKKNYRNIFSQSQKDPNGLVESIDSTIQQDSELASTCGLYS